jgi:outer membrane protein OmpA-like peptidoglycan-associated protein/tetratricopeptide (TPR) repeat protein
MMLCLSLSSINAQNARVKKGNKYLAAQNFSCAIKKYLKALDKKDILEAKQNLALAYRTIGDMPNAEYWYGQLANGPEALPEHRLYYAQALQANGKSGEARQYFEEYLALVPTDARARAQLNACTAEAFSAYSEQGAVFQVANLDKVNTAFDDLGPAFFKSSFLFSSAREAKGKASKYRATTGKPYLDLYMTKFTLVDLETYQYNFGTPARFFKKIRPEFHNGPVALTPDQSEIFFTRNSLKCKKRKAASGLKGLKIYSTRLTPNAKIKRKNIVSLPFNSDEYNTCNPTLATDGSFIVFASNMPGGSGGYDLYVSYLENAQWGPPTNLGSKINTEGDENFPVIQTDGSLVFSSDGHAGLGGFDLFEAKAVTGGWASPRNLGIPVNSSGHDYSMVFMSDKSHGFLVSNREGGKGMLDIYTFRKDAVQVDAVVVDQAEGTVIPGATIAGPGIELNTNKAGMASMELPLSQVKQLTANKEGYLEGSVATSTAGFESNDKLLVRIPVQKDLSFTVQGRALSSEDGKPLKGATVSLVNDCGEPEIAALTDDNGNYKLHLKQGCCYLVKATYPDHLTKTSKICVRDENNSQSFDLDFAVTKYKEEGPLYIEVENIYYDFDKATLRKEASTGLAELLSILQDNPNLVVEISSHTDSRGNAAYNERLSQRRAESVVAYLIKNGIDKSRLQAKGYGETKLANNCGDGKKCSDAEHQQNRRTEFMVVGEVKE